MKIMIASDIHGSAYYLEQLLNRYDEENPDKLLLLGDILYHGPRNDLPKGYAPKDVILLLKFSVLAISVSSAKISSTNLTIELLTTRVVS